MAGTMSRGEVVNLLRHIGVTERRIAAQIHEIEKQLKGLEAAGILNYPYWIFIPGLKIRDEDLRRHGKPRPWGIVLQEELEALKKQIRDLRATSKKIRVANPWLETLPKKRQGARASAELRGKIKAAVKRSEARGTIDEPAIGKLVDKVEENLRRLITILDQDPTEENARNVLKEMEIPLLFRGDFHLSSSEEAFNSLGKAGAKWVEQAKDRFSKTPTVDTLKFLLDNTSKAALVGTSDKALEITDVLEQNAEKVMKNAEDIFRRNPTVENFKTMEEAERFCVSLGKQPLAYPPPGLPLVPPGTTHPVTPGDTLSGISKKYFGSPGYWDVIYRKNRDLIKNPDAPAPGTKLVIS
jgi:nucleoid-associated protein YgaU